MRSEFEELNLLAYYALLNAFLDGVIWCLGPVVDDERSYGRFRTGLAIVTCTVCRRWLIRRGTIEDT